MDFDRRERLGPPESWEGPHVWNGERWVPLTPQDDSRAVDHFDRPAPGAGFVLPAWLAIVMAFALAILVVLLLQHGLEPGHWD